MAMMTLAQAETLQAEFGGRITSSHECQVEFQGNARILIPETTEEVQQALRLATASDRTLVVRSGRNISASDVKDWDEETGGAAIVSLETFSGIDVDGAQITVGPAATIGDLAKVLAGADLFLPLDDNPTRSVASAVCGRGASPFVRSGRQSGSLLDAVVEAEIVPIDGDGEVEMVGLDALREVLGGNQSTVITQFVLDADPTKTLTSDRWLRAWTAIYEKETFASLCDALLGTDARPFPPDVDLSIRATSSAFSMNLVIVRATGNGDASEAVGLIEAALTASDLTYVEPYEFEGSGSSVAAWVATGPGEAARQEVVRRFGTDSAPRPYAEFRDTLFEAVDYAIGVDAETGEERAPGVRAGVSLQLAADENVLARAEISDDPAAVESLEEARVRLSDAIPEDDPLPGMRGVMAPNLTTVDFDLDSKKYANGGTIPGFEGDVFVSDPPGNSSYSKSIYQYASCSYPPEVLAARMMPGIVAVPNDANSVSAAVNYAAENDLKVVARSGGHQYCGMSSGGADTLQINMRNFKKLKFSPNNKPTTVTIGSGVTLGCASKAMLAKQVVFPHGECPYVNIGGHVQSGGIGHQLRSLGATLDSVCSFKMVTRDPDSGRYAEREFFRPPAGGSNGSPTDHDVFRAVLGGGPSSFGVLTEVTLDLVSDDEFPDSGGYSYIYPFLTRASFGVRRASFTAAMEQFRQWAERQHSERLPEGVDFFLSYVSGDCPRPAALIVETMATSKQGLEEIKGVVDAVDDKVSWFRRRITQRQVNGPSGLSAIADKGVRTVGSFGLPGSGREFDLPYKKSLHITDVPFTEVFRDRFVDLVMRVDKANGLKVVFQGVIGGGIFLENAEKQTTHMQRRNALVQLVFDIFYEEGREAEAVAFQDELKDLLESFSRGEDIRMLWGSFEDNGTTGEQLEMGRPDTQALYYDSREEYERLQQIKAYTDPNDLFHTSFTVQLPRDG